MPISREAMGECRAKLHRRVASIRRRANCGTAAMPTPAATIAPTTEILSDTKYNSGIRPAAARIPSVT
ncbi:hypothetical protein G6F40_018229 [Rhizopus arrhizus]|nr:hypothetical protein G6F40_018229 [Rhizopus arrhizus]